MTKLIDHCGQDRFVLVVMLHTCWARMRKHWRQVLQPRTKPPWGSWLWIQIRQVGSCPRHRRTWHCRMWYRASRWLHRKCNWQKLLRQQRPCLRSSNLWLLPWRMWSSSLYRWQHRSMTWRDRICFCRLFHIKWSLNFSLYKNTQTFQPQILTAWCLSAVLWRNLVQLKGIWKLMPQIGCSRASCFIPLTHKSPEPVSKTTWNVWAGVPSWTGP